MKRRLVVMIDASPWIPALCERTKLKVLVICIQTNTFNDAQIFSGAKLCELGRTDELICHELKMAAALPVKKSKRQFGSGCSFDTVESCDSLPDTVDYNYVEKPKEETIASPDFRKKKQLSFKRLLSAFGCDGSRHLIFPIEE